MHTVPMTNAQRTHMIMLARREREHARGRIRAVDDCIAAFVGYKGSHLLEEAREQAMKAERAAQSLLDSLGFTG